MAQIAVKPQIATTATVMPNSIIEGDVFIDDLAIVQVASHISGAATASDCDDEYRAAAVSVGRQTVVEEKVRIFATRSPHENDDDVNDALPDGAEPAAPVEIGDMCWLCTGASLAPGCVLGNRVTLRPRARLGRDVKIGDHSYISAGVELAPGTILPARSAVVPVDGVACVRTLDDSAVLRDCSRFDAMLLLLEGKVRQQAAGAAA